MSTWFVIAGLPFSLFEMHASGAFMQETMKLQKDTELLHNKDIYQNLDSASFFYYFFEQVLPHFKYKVLWKYT